VRLKEMFPAVAVASKAISGVWRYRSERTQPVRESFSRKFVKIGHFGAHLQDTSESVWRRGEIGCYRLMWWCGIIQLHVVYRTLLREHISAPRKEKRQMFLDPSVLLFTTVESDLDNGSSWCWYRRCRPAEHR
jgi:hypothetical protein